MKNCYAGHELVLFSADRCPACEAIERLDKENLKLQLRIDDLKVQIVKLTNAAVSNWNGGAS